MSGRRRGRNVPGKKTADASEGISMAGKVTFALAVTALLVLVGTLSYIYLGGSQSAYTGTTDEGDYTPPPPLDLAPDFNYRTIDGGYVSLSGLRGNVVILDFMAMWCQPCGTQMGILAQVEDEYSGQDVKIISIDVDTSETEANLIAYKIEKGAGWDFVFDVNGIGSHPKYDATSIPTLIIIKKDGTIAQRYVGVTQFETMKAAIDPLV